LLSALIMAGGKARRMGGLEKALLKVCEKSMLERVVHAMSACVQEFYVVVTANTPHTSEFCKKRGWSVVQTSAKGFVEDVQEALEKLGFECALVVCSDLPFLSSPTVNEFLRAWEESKKRSAALYTTREYLETLGVKARTPLVAVGVNVIPRGSRAFDEHRHIVQKLDVLNVNTKKELELARLLCQTKKNE
jgi:adenosylcobinamide-phosphate guanylyltransferase